MKNKEIKVKFRYDPVPYTGSFSYRYFRRVRTTQEKRAACNTEIKQYIRAFRNFVNLPSTWDNIDRNCQRLWKNQSKAR